MPSTAQPKRTEDTIGIFSLPPQTDLNCKLRLMKYLLGAPLHSNLSELPKIPQDWTLNVLFGWFT